MEILWPGFLSETIQVNFTTQGWKSTNSCISPQGEVLIGHGHRWALLLKHQSLINVHHLSTKENKIPSSVSICSKQMEVCYFRFPFVCCNQNIYIHICIYICCCFKRKTEAHAIFLNPFAHCVNENLSFVHLLTKKIMEVFCLQTE